eukprot:TRINITY_DN20205_c0_g1_i2.p1 TRINITY_DN20205_c0_g1~~TRINITY_DN20205_c0_g1_i2.p1  ORF type:complete len:290 (-),score=45.36 TRINITY_DN20205_c0_g1_i2:112-981(-)
MLRSLVGSEMCIRDRSIVLERIQVSCETLFFRTAMEAPLLHTASFQTLTPHSIPAGSILEVTARVSADDGVYCWCPEYERWLPLGSLQGETVLEQIAVDKSVCWYRCLCPTRTYRSTLFESALPESLLQRGTLVQASVRVAAADTVWVKSEGDDVWCPESIPTASGQWLPVLEMAQVERDGPFYYQVLSSCAVYLCDTASFYTKNSGGNCFTEGELVQGSCRVAAEGTCFVRLSGKNSWIYESDGGQPMLKQIACTPEQFSACMQAADVFSPRNPGPSQIGAANRRGDL